MDLINALKTVNTDRADAEELMVLLAQGRHLQSAYEAEKFPAPAWLTEAVSTLGVEVKRRRRDQLELALKQARQKADGLKTAEQRRGEVASEIAALEKMLAETSA